MTFKGLEEDILRRIGEGDSVKDAVGNALDDFEFNECEGGLLSSPLGYIEGLPQFGRFKRNTKYKVYVIEVEDEKSSN